MAQLSRRHVLRLGAGIAGATVIGPGRADDGDRRVHGLSAFGELKYPATFTSFDYVNADAPKGGLFSQVVGSGDYIFDTFNAFIPKGNAANGMELTFSSLMARAQDEPDAVYLFAAEELTVSADGTTFRFRLRQDIRFHDGSRIKAEDVAFSLDALKTQGFPSYRSYLSDVAEVIVEDERTIVLRLTSPHGLDVAPVVASLPILSKAYYANKSFAETSLEPPLGSGPYRISQFEQGRFVQFERVKDWWGADLPVCRGSHNFDILRDEYYRDREAGFQAFTGRNYLFREEFTAKSWATRYDFPAIRDGRVKRETIPDERPSAAQGWLFNTRREKFKDWRVRDAIGMLFDFEWTNKNVMYDAYQRTYSVFKNSDMMAKGEPTAGELALLAPFRDRLPSEVFGPAWIPPVTDGSGQDRQLRRRAADLLTEAGWTVKDGGRRVNAKNEAFTIEFLLKDPTFEPHHGVFIKNLRSLGIEAAIRLVDSSQETARKREFDFDIIVARFILPQIPGAALRGYFSSQYANAPGSDNLAGIADPVVDELLKIVAAAKSQAELNTASRALDRVLRSGRYWVPQWSSPNHRIAYWDEFSHPAIKPRFDRGAPETWWYDPVKATKAAQAKKT